ncbi:MAG TPA: class 1 fructose-bisphosphatase [Calditrichia bacterium]|nr:class 1 fructose-bisphosphatase [Calditrichota bacterium]HQU71641.1 class 1 fructose-bisphosphatase [Calditrichia bacterium]HQV32858.1 class 1 fructose-bisphosphatase [Calditrichia bacterium]
MNNFVMTLNRFIVESGRKYPEATGAFTSLLADIALAAKVISIQVNKAGLLDIFGGAGSENVFGEAQQKLDVSAHEAMVKSLRFGGACCAMVSEEDENIIDIPEKYPKGKYICCFDPLDGSSNIDVNVSIGTIFSIFRRVSPDNDPITDEDILQPGYSQVCSGYVIYGSSTMLVYTTGNGVHGFTFDPQYGSFILSHPKMVIPRRGNIVSANESNSNSWHEGLQRYLKHCKEPQPKTGKPMTSRYIGSLVADFHRNLLKGGVYLYPGDQKNPNGKLRLMYEANPLAFLVEQAGGRAITGKGRVMDVTPGSLHDRTPLIIGSKENVNEVEEYLKGKR